MKIKVFLYSFIGTGIGLLFLMYLIGFSNITEGKIIFFVTLWVILSSGIAGAAIYEEKRYRELNKKDKMSQEKENIFAISLIMSVIPTCISVFLILIYFDVELGTGLWAKGTIAILFIPLFVLYGVVFYLIVRKIYKKYNLR